jgi:hypothetical protein
VPAPDKRIQQAYLQRAVQQMDSDPQQAPGLLAIEKSASVEHNPGPLQGDDHEGRSKLAIRQCFTDL